MLSRALASLKFESGRSIQLGINTDILAPPLGVRPAPTVTPRKPIPAHRVFTVIKARSVPRRQQLGHAYREQFGPNSLRTVSAKCPIYLRIKPWRCGASFGVICCSKTSRVKLAPLLTRMISISVHIPAELGSDGQNFGCVMQVADGEGTVQQFHLLPAAHITHATHRGGERFEDGAAGLVSQLIKSNERDARARGGARVAATDRRIEQPAARCGQPNRFSWNPRWRDSRRWYRAGERPGGPGHQRCPQDPRRRAGTGRSGLRRTPAQGYQDRPCNSHQQGAQ